MPNEIVNKNLNVDQKISEDKSYLLKKTVVSKIASGVAVSSTLFPLESLKKIMQQGKKFNLTKSQIAHSLLTTGRVGDYVVYKGLCAFALNVVPTTFLQLTIEQELSKRIPDDAPVHMRILRAMASGAIAATTATMVENTITIQQVFEAQKKPSSLRVAFMDMWNFSPMRVFRSYPLIAARDAVFTLNLFFLNPVVEKYLQNNFTMTPTMSMLISPIPLAVLGATLSHPFDTLATNLQMTNERWSGFKDYKRVFNELVSGPEGYRSLFRGLPARMPLFYGFLLFIPMARKKCESVFDNNYHAYASSKNSFFPRPVVNQNNVLTNKFESRIQPK